MPATTDRHPTAATWESCCPRIVLDTNVCLDLWVFADPQVSILEQAIRSGTIQPVTDPACRSEWERVLGYPQLALPQTTREQLLARYDACFVISPSGITATPVAPLPRCADPDDQKFLELARAADARWLLSRDRALLALSSRIRRDDHFEILSPAHWAIQWSADTGFAGRETRAASVDHSSKR